MITYKIIPMLLKDELKSRKISVRSLGNKNSENYIGYSDKTIFRALKNGFATKSVCLALSELLNYDGFILTDMNEFELEIEHLKKENDILKKQLEKLKSKMISDDNAQSILDYDVKMVNNDIIRTAIKQAYNELGSGRVQPNRLFNILAENGYINIRIGETDVSKWSNVSNKEFLKMDGFGSGSMKFLRRAIDILNGADPLPK